MTFDPRPPATHSYSAFGLSVESCLELPELTPGEAGAARPDVIIRRGDGSFSGEALAGDAPTVAARDDGLLYALANVGAFVVRGGREIEVDPAAEVEPRVLRLSLLGPAMSMLLHQRGHLLVHAGASVVDGRAALFVGRHNGGKSTMTAAMAARGHSLLSDDLTCVDLDASPPRALAGLRQVKLCPDAAEALVPAGQELHELHPDSPKVGFRPESSATAPAAAPIARVYFLEEAPDLAICAIDSDRALARLISHWYGARFGRAMLDIIHEGELFRRCVQLAGAVSFRILTRPKSLELLSRVTELVEKDMAARERFAV